LRIAGAFFDKAVSSDNMKIRCSISGLWSPHPFVEDAERGLVGLGLFGASTRTVAVYSTTTLIVTEKLSRVAAGKHWS
jgi:hypothetical protein